MLRLTIIAMISMTLGFPVKAGSMVETARGSVEITGVPQTVVAIDPTAIDTLQALGVELKGIPRQQLLDYVSPVGTTPVGTLFEPDLEAIAGLAPDLIIVGDRSAKSYDAVARIAPTLDMTMSANLIVDAQARLATYGRLFGKEEKADELSRQLTDRLAQLRLAASGKGRAMIVMTNGPKMSAYGRGSRFGWIYDATALPEAAEGLPISSHGATISQEFIAEKDPDWIFVLDRAAAIRADQTSAQETLDTPLLRSTRAWKNAHIVYLPAAEMYIGWGGHQAIIAVIDSLTAALSK